jgi:Flp pilus assembly protein TadG
MKSGQFYLKYESRRITTMKPFVRVRSRNRSRLRQRGNNFVEFALMLPWIVFLFIGVLDAGFYGYGLIATENAARVAALYASSSSQAAGDSAGACTYALTELGMTANVNGLGGCTSLPLKVTAQSGTGPDGSPATTVSVTYQSVPLIPIPGLLTGQLTVTRTVQMRVKG